MFEKRRKQDTSFDAAIYFAADLPLNQSFFHWPKVIFHLPHIKGKCKNPWDIHMHTHTHTHIYIYIYVYMSIANNKIIC